MYHCPKRAAILSVLVASVALVTAVTGQETATRPSADALAANAKFAIHVDVAAFRKTHLGGRLFEVLREKAVEEIVSGSGNEEAPEKIEEALGFDPFDEIKGFTVVGSDFEHPEDNLKMVIQMGNTTGNLEGLLLGLPAYDASSYGDELIHTAAPDGRPVFGAIHTDGAGIKTIAVATSRKDVIQLLDAIDGKTVAKQLNLPEDDRSLLRLRVDELPLDKIEEGPVSNVAKLLKHVVVVVNDERGDFDCRLLLTAKQDKQAEQLQQMAQGLVAMLALAEPEPGEEEKMEELQGLLEGLRVERQGSDVRLELKVPSSTVRQFLEDEADLSL